MRCTSCEANLPEGSPFCEQCGTKVENVHKEQKDINRKKRKIKRLRILVPLAILIIVGGEILLKSILKKTHLVYNNATLLTTLEDTRLVGLSYNGTGYVACTDKQHLTLYDLKTNEPQSSYLIEENLDKNYKGVDSVFENSRLLYSPDRSQFVMSNYNLWNNAYLRLQTPHGCPIFDVKGDLVNEIGTSSEKEDSKYLNMEYAPTYAIDGKSIIYEQMYLDDSHTYKFRTMQKDLETNEVTTLFSQGENDTLDATVQVQKELYLTLSYQKGNYKLFLQSNNSAKEVYEISLPEEYQHLFSYRFKNYTEDRHTFLIEAMSTIKRGNSFRYNEFMPLQNACVYFILTFNKDFTEYDFQELSFDSVGEEVSGTECLELSPDGSYIIGVKQPHSDMESRYTTTKYLFLYQTKTKEEIILDSFEKDEETFLFPDIDANSTIVPSPTTDIFLSHGKNFAVYIGDHTYRIYQLTQE